MRNPTVSIYSSISSLLLFLSFSSSVIAADYGVRLNNVAGGNLDDVTFSLLDATGEELVTGSLESMRLDESEGLLKLRVKQGADTVYRYFDLKAQQLLPGIYEHGHPFSEGLAAVKKDDLWGYINRQGEWVVLPRYYEVTDFNDGIARVTYMNLDHAKWSEHIDLKGNLLPISEKDDVGVFSEGLAIRTHPSSVQYVNERGEPLITERFSRADPFTPFGLANVDSLKSSITREQFMLRMSQNIEISEPAATKEAGSSPSQRHGSAGIIDDTGKWLFEPRYSRIRIMADDRFVFRDDDKYYRVVDRKGEIVLPPMDGYYSAYGHNIYYEGGTELWGFIDTKGAWVINAQFDRVGSFSEGFAAARKGDKWGYINREGKWVISPQYDAASRFSEGVAAVLGDDGLWGYIDVKGQPMSPLRFNKATPFSHGFASVQIGKKYGYVNRNGQWLVEPRFDIADSFSEYGHALVKQDDNFMQVDTTGAVSEPHEAGKGDVSERSYKGTTAVSKEGVWGVVDDKNKVLVPFMFTDARPYRNGMAAVKFGDGWHFTNDSELFSTSYDYASDYNSDGIAMVVPTNNPSILNYIDRKGRVLLTRERSRNSGGHASFSEEDSFENERLVDKLSDIFGSTYGFRDASGKWAIPPRFDFAYSFSEGLAAVRVNNSRGALYDRNGKVIVPFGAYAYRMLEEDEYLLDGSTSSTDVRYIYRSDDGGRYITDGQSRHLSQRLDSIMSFSGRSYATAELDGKVGLIDRDGKWLIYPRYTQAKVIDRLWVCEKSETEKQSGCESDVPQLMVRSDDEYGFVDLNGEWLAPPKKGSATIGELDGVPLFRVGTYTYAVVTSDGEWVFSTKEEVGRLIKNRLREEKSDSVSKFPKRIKGLATGEFIDGIAIRRQGRTFDYVDTKGEAAIAQRFDDARPFFEGLAAVQLNKLWGYINRKGKIVITPRYKMAESFQDGRAVVQSAENSLYGVIDTEGKIVVPTLYSKIQDFKDGYSAVQDKDNKWYLLNRSGVIGETPYNRLTQLTASYPYLISVPDSSIKEQLLDYSGEVRSPMAADIEVLAYPYAILMDAEFDITNTFTFALRLWNVETQKIKWEKSFNVRKE
jgi:hypothetical protein